jgi:hypothetical protein
MHAVLISDFSSAAGVGAISALMRGDVSGFFARLQRSQIVYNVRRPFVRRVHAISFYFICAAVNPGARHRGAVRQPELLPSRTR